MKSRRAFLGSVLTATALAAALLPQTASAFLFAGGSATGAAPATSITIANFTADRVFQRDKGTYTAFNTGTKTIAFSGTFSGGSPSAFNITVNGITYAGSNVVVGAGTWACTAIIPTGDGYSARVTDATPGGSATSIQTNVFGVGILIAMLGQSNMEKMWQTSTGSPPAGDSHVRWTKATGWWVTNKGSTGTNNAGGNGLVSFANALRAAFVAAVPGDTTPVGLVAGAIGATFISSWQTGGSSWTTWTTMVTDAQVGGDYEFLLWNQGEWDSSAAASPGGSPSYATSLANVYSQAQAQTGRTSAQLPFGVATNVMLFTGAGVNFTNANTDIVRAAHIAQAAQSNCFYALTCQDFTHIGADAWHVAAASYARMGLRYAKSICKVLGIATYGGDGPKIASASWPVGTNTLTVTVSQLSGGTGLRDGAGGTSGAGLIGFVINSTGGQTVTSTAFSGNTIVFTMSANRGGGDTVNLCYGGGFNPWGWVNDVTDSADHLVYDNQSAYLGDTAGFPLQPTSGGLAAPMTVGT